MTPDTKMRQEFEQWYCEDAKRQGVEIDSIAHLREGNTYGEGRSMLNGKWEGWQACASRSTHTGAGALPADMVMVPKEPTEAMLQRAMDECGGMGSGYCGEYSGVDWDDMRCVWEAMLAAHQGGK